MYRLFVTCVALVGFMVVAIGHAAEVTEDELSRWIASMEELQETPAWPEQLPADQDEAIGAYQEAGAARPAVLAAHQFELERWQEVTDRVIRALTTLETARLQPKIWRRVQEQRKVIEQSDEFSDEQKAEMSREIDRALMSFMYLPESDPADRAVIREHVGALRVLFDLPE